MYQRIFLSIYRFYKWTKVEAQPVSTAIFVMATLEAAILNGMIQFQMLSSCKIMEVWQMLVVFAVILGLNLLYFYFRGSEKRIINSK